MMRRFACWAVAIAFAVPGVAAAQTPRPAPPGIQGLVSSQNQDAPVQIEAATLEVRDKNKMATFSGNVQVVQGDTTMKCASLVVFYGAEGAGVSKPAASAAQPASGGQPVMNLPQGAQSIRRIEARGGVTVVTRDQSASGELGIYDLKSKTITLTGNVVVSQGKNVLHGDRVVVDMATGNAKVESGAAAQNRVRALILPSKGSDGNPVNTMVVTPDHPN